MGSLCVSPIKARVARYVLLDTCGIPVTGSGSMVVVTKGFIKVEASADYEEGQEFLVKNANGDPCVNEKDPSFLKRMTLTIDSCQVDPDTIIIVTGERLITGGGDSTGVAFSEAVLTNRFSLELWTPIAGQACVDGDERFVYWAFPNLGNPKVGNFTFENGPITFQTIAETSAAAEEWDEGPGSGTKWLPSGQGMADDEHWAFNVTTTAPPTIPDECGAVALT